MKKEPIIITVANRKGGVAKTTTAYNVGIGLANKGYKVLFIDLDPQANLTYYVSGELEEPITILEVLTDKVPVKDLIVKMDHVDLLPSSQKLALADSTINSIGKEYKLKEALSSIKKDYDFIIIDTPPTLNILTINALTTSNYCIIPSTPDLFSIKAIMELNETIQTLKKYCNRDLSILGIVLTRVVNRTNLTKSYKTVLNDLASELNTIVLSSEIRENNAIKEAEALRQSVYAAPKKTNAKNDYIKLVDEIETILKGSK